VPASSLGASFAEPGGNPEGADPAESATHARSRFPPPALPALHSPPHPSPSAGDIDITAEDDDDGHGHGGGFHGHGGFPGGVRMGGGMGGGVPM